MRRVIAGGCLLLMGCAAPKPTPPILVETRQPIDECDKAKIKAIARKYIPKITSPASHPLEAEMAYKTMHLEFVNMTMTMLAIPRAKCWNIIESEVDNARIAAARDRGEFDRR